MIKHTCMMRLNATKGLKGRLPFRLGTTSYILPSDMITNVAMLAPFVDDVELLFFELEELLQ